MKNHTKMLLREVVKISLEEYDPNTTIKNKFVSCVNTDDPAMEYLVMDSVLSVVSCEEHLLPANIILHKPKYVYEIKTKTTYIVKDLL